MVHAAGHDAPVVPVHVSVTPLAAEIVPVGFDVAEPDVYPDFMAVTATVIVEPTSAVTSVYVEAVAPEIFDPLRFH
jgi:hypothetical protein